MQTSKGLYRFGMLLLLGMFMLVITGCGNNEVGSADNNENVTNPTDKNNNSDNPVTVTVWMGSWWEESVPKIVDAYKEEHPNVTLKFETIPINGYLDKAISTELGGNSPDVLALDGLMIGAMAGRDMLEPLDEHVKHLDAEDFHKGSWDSNIMNDHMYGVPYRGESQVFFYNKKMFDEADVDYPTEEWTQADMLEMAKKITVPGEKYGVGIAAATSDPANVMSSFAPVLWSFNGDFLNDTNTEAIINQPEGVEAITFWTELYTKHKVVPEGSVNFALTKDVQPMFLGNQIAMMPGSTSALDLFNKTEGLEFGMVTAPDKFGRGGSWSFTIPKSAKNKQAGIDFALWFIEPENLGKLSSITFPSRKSATDIAPWNSEDMQYMLSAAPYQKSMPVVTKWTEMQNVIIFELQKVLAGTKTPQESADEMAIQMNKLLDE